MTLNNLVGNIESEAVPEVSLGAQIGEFLTTLFSRLFDFAKDSCIRTEPNRNGLAAV
jgi:hypothetical protein